MTPKLYNMQIAKLRKQCRLLAQQLLRERARLEELLEARPDMGGYSWTPETREDVESLSVLRDRLAKIPNEREIDEQWLAEIEKLANDVPKSVNKGVRA